MKFIVGGVFAAVAASLVYAAPPPRQDPSSVERIVDQLGVTDDEKPAVDTAVREYRQKQQAARDEFLAKMKAALTPDQYAKLESSMTRPGPPAPPRRGGGRETAAAATSRPNVKLPDGSLQVPVIFTGGYETDPRDNGRPVVLIAAALGVPTDVFRKAFSGVTPASGGEAPQDAQVRRNKQALLKVLGPYGITNDQLDTVSNQYRYAGSKGEMWRNTPAVATAHVVNGIVKSFTITDPGSGYSSPPEVFIAGMDDVKAVATLQFGTDFKTNGSIKMITLKEAKAMTR